MGELLQNIKEVLLRRQDVERVTGLGRSALWERLNPDSRYYDPDFPKPISLGSSNSVRWVATEVYGWVQHKIQSSRATEQVQDMKRGLQ
ncbi:MAG: AlpA family phage regulatory protein [Pseudomonadales bacterium]|nr:AlpA family phage regulatory protein [Pseudomonadales bacterium]